MAVYVCMCHFLVGLGTIHMTCFVSIQYFMVRLFFKQKEISLNNVCFFSEFHVCVYTHVCVCVFVCMCMCGCICVGVYVWVCMCGCVSVYMWEYTLVGFIFCGVSEQYTIKL